MDFAPRRRFKACRVLRDVFRQQQGQPQGSAKSQKRCVDVPFERSDLNENRGEASMSTDVVKPKILRCKVVFNEHTLNGRGSLFKETPMD